jgi:2-phosphosulfolactate phosphatase
MKVELGSLLEDAKEALGTVIIIDVFRAFTTAAVAFDRGAKSIILVAGVEEAKSLRQQGIGDILMGEEGGAMPDGFDLGNSPNEASQHNFSGKTVIQSTRAGTVGVVAAEGADNIFLGSLVVAQATVDAIRSDNPNLVTVVAMGDQGVVRTDEDEQCGLFLRNLLEGRRPDGYAVGRLIMEGNSTRKFYDSSQPQYQPQDVELALEVDRYPFAMKVSREGGLLVARKYPG